VRIFCNGEKSIELAKLEKILATRKPSALD
jgi:hypothetical protein